MRIIALIKKLFARDREEMDYGIKISRPGYDVMELSKSKTRSKTETDGGTLPHMIAGLALPYLHGARTQLHRFKRSAEALPGNPAGATVECLHEASALFEDLDTVDRYIQMCGKTHKMHTQILNIRNHIRHDLRDNLDHESNKGRKDRARKLGISKELITNIGFDPSAVKVGKTIVLMKDIEKYLTWAEGVFGQEIKAAKEKGMIEGVDYDG